MRTLPTLWYENAAGEIWIPPTNFAGVAPPGFDYQHARFPCRVDETICTRTGLVGSGSSSYPPSLVLAMTRPTWRERAIAFWRYRRRAPRLSLEQAILYAAVSCERCTNCLAHRFGLAWGYRRGGPEDRARTFCAHCGDVDLLLGTTLERS